MCVGSGGVRGGGALGDAAAGGAQLCPGVGACPDNTYPDQM
jgi:hypothetical protein